MKGGGYLVCGGRYGRGRSLFNEAGKQVDEPGPSISVVVRGLSGVQEEGDDFTVVSDERLAKDVAQQRDAKRRAARLVQSAGSRIEDILSQLGKGEGQLSVNLIIEAVVQG